MADFASALAAGIAACDELCVWQGQPTVTSRLQNTITQAQYDAKVAELAAMTGERDARQTVITNMKAAANADKAADAASVAGQGVLDAAAGF